jgi:uncharacterized membrane protein YedE/YeeE
MSFENFTQAQSFFLWSTFVIALVMGAVVNKTNFCTMGAVSDWVNMGDTGRLRAWLFAIAVAMIGVVVLEKIGMVNANGAFPPYRGSQLIWAENLLGGLMFGVGMTLASGCGNKTLIRIGGGNLKSIMVLAIIAVIAYFMVNPFPGTDKTLFTVLFYDWLRPLAITLKGNQDLGSIISPNSAVTTRLIIGGALGLALIAFALKSSDFRGSFDNILGGLVVGLAVLAAWYVTSNVLVNADGEVVGIQKYVNQWDFYAAADAVKPAASSVAPQSFTFINPMGQTLGFIAAGFKSVGLTFGVMALLGVIAGSFLWSMVTRSFRIEWFASGKDFANHFVGAVLMGFGGVLGMGCTIGQGITGISTLAVGSFITFIGIVLGSALTMKVQYYKMVYESDATFLKALVTALVDLKLLPAGLRRLEAV